MKIAWFTPFIQDSAIGMVSKEICEELIKRVDIDIWCPKSENLISTSVNVIEFYETDGLYQLEDYDFIVYNMGNFAGYHREIYDISLRYPGVVICHDQTMSSFFGQYYTIPEFGGDNSTDGYKEYASFLKKYCGNYAVEEIERGREKNFFPIYEYGNISKYRLIEPLLKNAIAVFVHAEFFCDEIKKYYNRPVAFSYLPCRVNHEIECDDKIICGIIRRAKEEKKKILVSNGIVHPVKQIDQVINVFLAYPELAENFVYLVIGSYGGEYGERLVEFSKGRLKNCLFMLGYQSSEVMNYALKNADMCINLRYPNSEVCSLSLLDQMSFEKPVLVINSGIYGEMPDNAVLKIDNTNLQYEIKEKLQAMMSTEDFLAYGRNAKKFVESQCTVKMYCDQLLGFLSSMEEDQAVKNLQNRTLETICKAMQELGINDSSAPATVECAVTQMMGMFNADRGENCRVRVIGIWSAFHYKVSNLSREGISHFMGNMISAIVKKYSVNIEVWCYSFNEQEERKTFSEVPADKIRFVTEKNWREIFGVNDDTLTCVGDVNAERDNLNVAARMVSKADIMLPLIIYLDSVVGTDKRIFAPAHDMAVAYHFDDFVTNDKRYKSRQTDILARVNHLAQSGATFFSNSNCVREKQILPFVRSLRPERSKVVYLPVNIPKDLKNCLIDEEIIRNRFKLLGKYLFYPTQVRPYKNFQTLIKALAILKSRKIDISLVITGEPKDVPEVQMLIEKLKVNNMIIKLNNVNEFELYSIYKYAAATPVPSCFEGGFPWQACEALFMNTPVVLSKIDVVEERIAACGFSFENCGMNLFDPLNEMELADHLEKTLLEREQTVFKQRAFAEKLLNYTWSDAAEQYYEMFCMK